MWPVLFKWKCHFLKYETEFFVSLVITEKNLLFIGTSNKKQKKPYSKPYSILDFVRPTAYRITFKWNRTVEIVEILALAWNCSGNVTTVNTDFFIYSSLLPGKAPHLFFSWWTNKLQLRGNSKSSCLPSLPPSASGRGARHAAALSSPSLSQLNKFPCSFPLVENETSH